MSNIWHPFTQMKTAGPPIHIQSAKGALLYDKDGNEYIDAVSSWWVTVHGHAHPYIAERVHKQLLTLEHVIFAGFTHDPAMELAERLLAYLPEQSKVFFSDNGSTAVEVGMKMSLQYFHNQGEARRAIVALEHAYHGDTFGAMSAGGDDGFNDPFKPLMFDVERIPSPLAGKEKEALAALEQVLKAQPVCCFIFEPLVQGAGGMLMYEPEVLDEMMALCRSYGVLCIADEVMTGFYRTGKMFASHYLRQQPDIVCLSKGLTGGALPMSITACSEAIYEAFLSEDKMKTFFHGHSFTGNPIGCTAALASLDLFERSETQSNIKRVAASHARFAKRLRHHPAAGNVRQRGTILALEVKTANETSYFNDIRDHLYDFFLSRGVLLRPLGNVVYIMPPYCISDEELERVYRVVSEALDRIQSHSESSQGGVV